MELILTEWMGVNEQIKLNYDNIFDLYFEYFAENNKELILKHKSLEKQNDLNYEDKNNYYNLIEDNKNKIIEIFKNENNFNKISSEINKLNTFHRDSIKGDNVNPIIEIYKNNDEYYVKTYQYVTEFEIDLSNNKKKTEKNVLKIKIQARNLVSYDKFKIMLEDIFNIKTLDDISGTESNDFLILFYFAYLTKLKEVLKRGIHRNYVDYEDNLPYLKERLLIHEHTRYNYIDRSKFYCAYSELSPDNLINKAILKSILHIKKYRAKELSKHIHQISQSVDLSEITDLNFNLKELNNIKFNRQNIRFKEIVEYCKVILKNAGASFSSNSDLKYSSFYLDMNELFESFFAKRLEKLFREDLEKIFKLDEEKAEEVVKPQISNLDSSIFEIIKLIIGEDINASYRVSSQNKMLLDEEGTFNIIPDVIVYKDSKVVAVLDTKYKRLNDSSRYNYNISREDIYQVITYAHRLNTTKAFLVYPKPPEQKIENKEFKIQEINLHICFVDLLEEKDNTDNSKN